MHPGTRRAGGGRGGLDVLGGGGGGRHRLLEVHFRYPNEVLRLLEAAGFTIDQVFGGFDGRPLDSTAEDLIWVARAD